MAPSGQSSDSSDSAPEDEIREESSVEPNTGRTNTGPKRKRAHATAKAKVKRPELKLDLSNPDDRIMDMVKQLKRKCDGWRSKRQRPPPERSCGLKPPAARIADGTPSFTYALHDFSVFAIRSYFDRATCSRYEHDFESKNGLVRGSRVPMGKGVVKVSTGGGATLPFGLPTRDRLNVFQEFIEIAAAFSG